MRGKYSEQQKISTMKHVEENYERIYFNVRKGKKEKYKQLAEQEGISLSALIIRLLNDEAVRIGFDLTTAPTPSQLRKEK